MTKRIQWERPEQNALVAWFQLQYPAYVIFKIPNDLIRSDCQAWMEVKSGLVGGMPDIMIPVMRGEYGGLFIELKRTGKLGKISNKQKAMIDYLRLQGYYSTVCKGWDEARADIVGYMNLRKNDG